ncbi:thiamine phosphate synthase [Micromonospora sp. NPDC000207]|uniref:thiamine phosphate synthase n=1 Tax=Micromonospora sp. NPDC000207 TaxID=3154246 RepID=UPI003317E416
MAGPEPATTPSGVVVLTGRVDAPNGVERAVAGAVAGGVRWVVLRERDLPRAERAALAVELRAILAEVDGTLIVAGPDPLDGDAVHLPARGPYPPPTVGLVGRSCHDAAELARLTTEDYVTLSPVWPTDTKPGHGPPLHPDGLARLVGRSPVPVLALGGVTTPGRVSAAVAAGAAGVAVLGAIMRAGDPAETATALTAAFTDATSGDVSTDAAFGRVSTDAVSTDASGGVGSAVGDQPISTTRRGTP